MFVGASSIVWRRGHTSRTSTVAFFKIVLSDLMCANWKMPTSSVISLEVGEEKTGGQSVQVTEDPSMCHFLDNMARSKYRSAQKISSV